MLESRVRSCHGVNISMQLAQWLRCLSMANNLAICLPVAGCDRDAILSNNCSCATRDSSTLSSKYWTLSEHDEGIQEKIQNTKCSEPEL